VAAMNAGTTRLAWLLSRSRGMTGAGSSAPAYLPPYVSLRALS
jgi:hypothetical protein